MDNYQLTFYGVEMPPAVSEATPTPPPKPKPAKPETPRVTMIRELPTSEQPVHRLEHFGAGALSTVELLTIATGFDNFEDAQVYSRPMTTWPAWPVCPCPTLRRSRASAPPAPPASRRRSSLAADCRSPNQPKSP